MKKTTLWFLTLSLLCLSGAAVASHKSWVLKNSGASCVWATPQANDRLGIAYLYNYTASTRMAICPVALSGRWGSNGPGGYNFDANRWGAMRSAILYAQRQAAGSKTVSCSTWMKASNGSAYYSQTVSNTGNIGMATLEVIKQQVYAGDVGAGGTLEANEALTAMAMDFYCSVPSSTAIHGYKVRTCQRVEDCFEFQEPELDNGTGVIGSWIQTSGIECSPTSDSPSSYSRSSSGISVSGGSNYLRVFCPFTPTADDTKEIHREVRYTSIRYAGGANGSTCVTDGTCPSCRIKWFGRDGLEYGSTPLPKDAGAGRKLTQPNGAFNIKREVGAGVECVVPSGTTLEGVTSYVTRAPVTDGGV